MKQTSIQKSMGQKHAKKHQFFNAGVGGESMDCSLPSADPVTP